MDTGQVDVVNRVLLDCNLSFECGQRSVYRYHEVLLFSAGGLMF